mmetsp:Transcript_1396/g.1489  ORF Transcript_1396/g.1489 Transcript_1396/m.1489 type:complete len:237 (+) Transcript_1396:120-830(+)
MVRGCGQRCMNPRVPFGFRDMCLLFRTAQIHPTPIIRLRVLFRMHAGKRTRIQKQRGQILIGNVPQEDNNLLQLRWEQLGGVAQIKQAFGGDLTLFQRQLRQNGRRLRVVCGRRMRHVCTVVRSLGQVTNHLHQVGYQTGFQQFHIHAPHEIRTVNVTTTATTIHNLDALLRQQQHHFQQTRAFPPKHRFGTNFHVHVTITTCFVNLPARFGVEGQTGLDRQIQFETQSLHSIENR